jgi:hypothetical protein
MKLYFAAGLQFADSLKEVGVKRVLSSWLERKEDYYNDFEIFLDSGAYSAYTQGVHISNIEYIDYVKKFGLKVYAGLDVIGDAEATYKNNLEMKEAGLNPIPTYHYGEDISYLERYLKDFDYVALGGVAQLRFYAKVKKWLDTCFFKIKDYPMKKIHGFAITNPRLLMRYPFYSVDSTAWLGSKYGSVADYKGFKLIKSNKELFYLRNKDFNFVNKKNMVSYLKLEYDITRLWEEKGIKWN